MGASRTSAFVAAALATLLGDAASAQSMEGTPQGRDWDEQRPLARGAAPVYGRDDTPPNGVPGNGPFNNQMRKFSDPLGANGR